MAASATGAPIDNRQLEEAEIESVNPMCFTEIDFIGQKQVAKVHWLSNEEVYKATRPVVKAERLRGVQHIRGGLRRLYVSKK